MARCSGVARYPNFDFLRLGAALSVLFSHAFLIAEGDQKHEPLVMLSSNQGILGLLGVFVFFTMSGFLVTQSFESARAPLRFLAARLLRIYPALIVCLAICVLIGAAVTTLPVAEYLRHPDTWRFLRANLLMQGFDESLPGVVFVDNSVGTVVGGAFWSLRFEVYFYLMVLALGTLRLLDLRSAVVLLIVGLAASYFDWLGGFGWLLPYFTVGMVMYYVTCSRQPSGALAIAAGLGIVATVFLGQMLFAFALLGGYLAIYLATSQGIVLPRAGRFGDFSYGLYIYGWPVEVCVAHAFGGTATWWQVFLIGTAVALILAVLSWHLVERPALRLKAARSFGSLATARRPSPAAP
ncbi:MAG TPA: acyltransferase [Stellaceae bacterium]|nr:acyltransferase [Stellaceae bacterium]